MEEALKRVCDLLLDPNLGVRPAVGNKFHLGLTGEKCSGLRFIERSIYDHAAVVAPILQLRLTVNSKN